MVYALTEALRAIRRSKLTALATVGSLTIFMFLLGLFLAVHANLTAVASGMTKLDQVARLKERAVASPAPIAAGRELRASRARQ